MVSWPGSMISENGMIRVEANSYQKFFQSFVLSDEAFLVFHLTFFNAWQNCLNRFLAFIPPGLFAGALRVAKISNKQNKINV